MELQFTITIWKYTIDFDLELFNYTHNGKRHYFDNDFTMRINWVGEDED